MLYDIAVMEWVARLLGPVLDTPEPLTVIFAPPDRAFDESDDNIQERPELPRVSVFRTDYNYMPERAHSGTIRKLGLIAPDNKEMRRARYPMPIGIPYQIDMWTRYKWQVQRYLNDVLWEFHPQVKQLLVYIDEVWQDKKVDLLLDGTSDTTDLEPGDQPRLVRHTVSINAEAWLFDVQYTAVKVVEELIIEIRDFDNTDIVYAILVYPKQ
jgi:hypothetical protein